MALVCSHSKVVELLFFSENIVLYWKNHQSRSVFSPPSLLLAFEDGSHGVRCLAGEKAVGVTVMAVVVWCSHGRSTDVPVAEAALCRSLIAEECAVIPEGSERKRFVFSKFSATSLSLIDLPVLNVRMTF